MTNHYHYRSITQFLWVLHPKKDRLGVFSLTEWLVIQVGFLVYFLKRVSRGSCSFQKGILALTNINHQHLDLSGLYFHPFYTKSVKILGVCSFHCASTIVDILSLEPWVRRVNASHIPYESPAPFWIWFFPFPFRWDMLLPWGYFWTTVVYKGFLSSGHFSRKMFPNFGALYSG